MDEDREYEQTQADLDVEIVEIADLHGKTAVGSTPVVTHSMGRRFSPHQRTVQLILTTVTGILVLLVVLGSSTSVRNLAARALFGPLSPPSARLALDAGLFYIDRQPAWGQVSLDGHLLAHLPEVGIDAPLRLSRGRHSLQWRDEPFPLQGCIVSVPPDYTHSCFVSDSVQLPSGLTAWIITLSASVTMLPANLRTALIQAARTALDGQQSTEIVLPGEVYNYPGQNSIFTTARQPLRAILRFQLDTNPTSDTPCLLNESGQGCAFLEQNCHIFCPNPVIASSSEWNVLVKILPVWNYTALDGHSLARNQSDASGGAEGSEYLAPLSILWNSGSRDWRVTALFEGVSAQAFVNPTCGSAEDEVQIDPTLKNAEIGNFSVSWHFASGFVFAEGCAAVATVMLNSGSPSTSSSPRLEAVCLHRFGLFLAANSLAHQLWPFMPVADAYEQRLAQRLAELSGIPT